LCTSTTHTHQSETKKAVEKEGRKCLLISGDVKKKAFCEEAVEKTVKHFGKLDILVKCFNALCSKLNR
jgi:NAD(P)-dependent dehydrogenase (short-subunit alcohol dehydrogenase family)